MATKKKATKRTPKVETTEPKAPRKARSSTKRVSKAQSAVAIAFEIGRTLGMIEAHEKLGKKRK